MKKYKKILIIIGALILLISFFGFLKFNFSDLHIYVKNSDNDYYEKLAKECEKERSSRSCCLASVRAMKANSAVLAKDNKCPVGYRKEMFKCIGTYQWCQKRKAY